MGYPGNARCLEAKYSVWGNSPLKNVAQTLTILQELPADVGNPSVTAAQLISHGDLLPPTAEGAYASPLPLQTTRDIHSVVVQTGINPGFSVHISQLFIEIQEESPGGRRAHCPSLPRPSAAWVTAFVTVLVTVSVTSFTALSPASWAFFKASAMAVRKKEE